MRVLVVEDEVELAGKLARALGGAGFATDVAHDGREAERLGRSEPYDAVVLDLGLPRLDGLSVLRAWRGLLVFLSRWFQIESLYKFNAKFRPRWEPRFVVYAASRDLPRIGLAAMQAEGFVNLALPRLLRRRAKAPAPCAHAMRSAEHSARSAA